MGDIADMMLDGTICEGCGEFLDNDGPGFPRYCAGCEPDAKAERARKHEPPKAKVKCAVCGRKVKPAGLPDHMRDAHQV